MGQTCQTCPWSDSNDSIIVTVKKGSLPEGDWKGINKQDEDAHLDWLNEKRQFFVYENRKSLFSHSSIGFQYLAKVDANPGQSADASRFLKAEILVAKPEGGDGGEVYVRYTGVLDDEGKPLDMQNYIKKPQFLLNATIGDIRAVCDCVFDYFGNYHVTNNNCIHFTSQVLHKLQNEYKEDICIQPTALTYCRLSPDQMEAVEAAKQAWGVAAVTGVSEQTSKTPWHKLEDWCVAKLGQLKVEELQDKFEAGEKQQIETSVMETMSWLNKNRWQAKEKKKELELKLSKIQEEVDPIMDKVVKRNKF